MRIARRFSAGCGGPARISPAGTAEAPSPAAPSGLNLLRQPPALKRRAILTHPLRDAPSQRRPRLCLTGRLTPPLPPPRQSAPATPCGPIPSLASIINLIGKHSSLITSFRAMRVTALIAAILLVGLLRVQADTAPYLAAEMKLQMIAAACASFEADYGVPAPQTNWFAELTAKPNAVVNQKRIVFLNASDTKDSRGRDLVCVIPGKHNVSGVDVYSLGRDGRSSSGGDDPDDINNWNPARPWSRYYCGIHIAAQQLALTAGGIVALFALFWLIRKRVKTEPHAAPNAAPPHR
jgi:hypothetical protein